MVVQRTVTEPKLYRDLNFYFSRIHESLIGRYHCQPHTQPNRFIRTNLDNRLPASGYAVNPLDVLNNVPNGGDISDAKGCTKGPVVWSVQRIVIGPRKQNYIGAYIVNADDEQKMFPETRGSNRFADLSRGLRLPPSHHSKDATPRAPGLKRWHVSRRDARRVDVKPLESWRRYLKTGADQAGLFS